MTEYTKKVRKMKMMMMRMMMMMMMMMMMIARMIRVGWNDSSDHRQTKRPQNSED